MQDSDKSPQPSHIAQLYLATLGIVFGDIGTSPLYAFRESFGHASHLELTPLNVYGVLSLITWSLITVISIKYLLYIMKADNRREGGVLALGTLGQIALRKDKSIKTGALFVALFGAALLYGDGVITPAISVLSAIEGLQIATPVFEPYVIPITCLILIGLFSIQRHGTAKIGTVFGPVMVIWFATLFVSGLASVIQNPMILSALNPMRAYEFFAAHPHGAFMSLGAIFLVVTGGEALYADMGHFGLKPIQRMWFFVAFPGLLMNYFGQGALLLRDPSAIINPFYKLMPSWALLPSILLATMATIIASQAVISGVFSLTRQAIQLNFLPRIKIEHTSDREIGQIYIKAMNIFLAIGTLWLVFEFKSSSNLASAYGIAVSTTMVLTTLLAAIVARKIWKWSLLKTTLFTVAFLAIDIPFWLSNMTKFADGGWVPIAIAAVVLTCMLAWRSGRAVLAQRLRSKTLPFETLNELLEKQVVQRVKGTGVYMVGQSKILPPALLANLQLNRALHERVIFLTVQTADTPIVREGESVKIEPLENNFFRVILRIGYMQAPNVPKILKNCTSLGFDFDINDTTFVLSREIILASKDESIFNLKKKIFRIMTANAQRAADYFYLPPSRTVELGISLDI